MQVLLEIDRPVRAIIEPFRIKSVEPIRWTSRPVFGYQRVIATHQGRAAERILFLELNPDCGHQIMECQGDKVTRAATAFLDK